MCKSESERLWSRVQKNPLGCWLWVGKSTNGRGYGILRGSKGINKYAHRLSWELANKKDIPAGKIIRHSCDNPSCVRPDHLVLGSQRDNVYDMLKRRRFRGGGHGLLGESNPQAKLSEQDVLAIRACYSTGRFGYRRLARFFNVTPICIKAIVVGKHWRHIA